jgi:hypothetical protein
MSSRGLPGFLRRSLRRVEYDEEEDEVDDENDGDDKQFNDNHYRREREQDDLNLSNNNKNHNTIFSSVIEESVDDNVESQVTSIPKETKGNELGGDHDIHPSSSRAENNATTAATMNDTSERKNLHDSWPQELIVTSSPPHDDSSPTNHISPKNEPKTYQQKQFEKVLSAEVVNMSELRKLAWNGIPYQYRALVWKILLGYLPTNRSRREQTLRRKRSDYRDAIAQHYDLDDDSLRTLQEQETLRQVLVDVPRTQPEIPLFRNDRIKRSLARLLYIWAMRHPASSYVQGINDLATPLVAVFLADNLDSSTSVPPDVVLDGHVMNILSDEKLDQVEADVYWCLTNLLNGIQDHYTADQPGVQRMVARLEELVHRIDGDLTRHLRDDTGIQFLQFSFKWMNCLLLREFHLRCVFRLWDTYLSEKDGYEDFHVYVCAAFMCQFSSQLQEMNFDELFGFMQDIPTSDWTDTEIEVLLSQAFVLSTLFKGSDAHLTSTNGMS